MNSSLRGRSGWWLLAVAIIVTAAVYSAGLSGGWLFDDYPNIVNNTDIHIHHLDIASIASAALSSPSSEFRRPLASVTFALNYLASGLDPFWWKVTNVAIHLLNGLLVFILARMLLPLRDGPRPDPRHRSRRIGLIAALIAGGWMLLPINLTAVLYIVQRMASMANVFVLLGLIGYVACRRHMLAAPRHYWRSLLGCVASLVLGTAIGFTAKETAIMLPLYAFLVEWVLFRFAAASGRHRIDKPLAGLYVLILLVPLVVGLMWQLPHVLASSTWSTRDFTLRTRLLSEARIVCDYIRWTLVPTPDPLSFYHDNYVASSGLLTPWTTLACIVLIGVLIALALWLRRRAPLVSLGLLLFFGSLTLTSTILPLELVYEHRNYFASFGLLLAVVPLLAGRLPLALPRYVLLGGLMLLWTGQTAITAYAWGNPLRLAEMLAARAPGSPRAQYALGRTFIVYSDYDPDSIFTAKAYAPLERAAALPHSSILPEQALIYMNARMHRPIKPAWWDSMIAKLKAHPPGVQDISSMAALTKCARSGECDLSRQRMLDAFLAALSHPHPRARMLAIYGDYAWNVLGDHTLGERVTAEASKHDPVEPAYHVTLVRMLAAQGRYDEARQQIKALEALNIGGRLDDTIAGLKVLLPPRGQ